MNKICSLGQGIVAGAVAMSILIGNAGVVLSHHGNDNHYEIVLDDGTILIGTDADTDEEEHYEIVLDDGTVLIGTDAVDSESKDESQEVNDASDPQGSREGEDPEVSGPIKIVLGDGAVLTDPNYDEAGTPDGRFYADDGGGTTPAYTRFQCGTDWSWYIVNCDGFSYTKEMKLTSKNGLIHFAIDEDVEVMNPRYDYWVWRSGNVPWHGGVLIDPQWIGVTRIVNGTTPDGKISVAQTNFDPAGLGTVASYRTTADTIFNNIQDVGYVIVPPFYHYTLEPIVGPVVGEDGKPIRGEDGEVVQGVSTDEVHVVAQVQEHRLYIPLIMIP